MLDVNVDIARLWRGIFNGLRYEFIYGGHLVSLGAPAYVLSVSLLMGMEPLKQLLLISYLMPLIVYNYNYFGEMDSDESTNPERVHYVRSKTALYPVIIISYMAVLAIALYLYANWGLIEFVSILVIGGVLFTVVLKDLTKMIPCFKNVYTALIWAFGGTFFPVFYLSLHVGWFFILVFMFMYSRSIANVIFFDLKDMEGDAARGLKTLPTLVGKKRTDTVPVCVERHRVRPAARRDLHWCHTTVRAGAAPADGVFILLFQTSGNCRRQGIACRLVYAGRC